MNRICLIAIALTVLINGSSQALALNQADEGAIRNAWGLYTQKKYVLSAEAFEKLIGASHPSARLCYYAALANREANRPQRARQLCQYIVTNFGRTTEASYALRLYPDLKAPAAQESPATVQSVDDLPESVKATLSPEARELLKTEIGKKALADAMKGQQANLELVRKSEREGVLKPASVAAARTTLQTSSGSAKRRGRLGDRVFTPEEIARDGANGIDQSRYPNCWFECSMSALAMLPRGQRLMADMIRYGNREGTYVVRFPGDGVEYTITEDYLDKSGVHDKALWATLIEAAQVMKFPSNQGANGADGEQSRLEVGLGCITGRKAEIIYPSSASAQEISLFIGGAIKSGNPVICGTFGATTIASLPSLVVPQHAYTVIGFDPSTSLITIRNPHGSNAQRFSMPTDPHHREFEQLDDGVFKISINQFQKYFHSLARSFI